MADDLKAAMDGLEARFTEWAESRDDIRAAVVVGSRARLDHPADAWADLDVGIATTNPGKYHRDTGWLSEIAPVWTMYRDPSGVTYHVLFDGGLDAGIAVLPVRAFAIAGRMAPVLKNRFVRGMPIIGKAIREQLDSGSDYYAPGYRVLFDKDGAATSFLEAFPAPATKPRKAPSRKAFRDAISEFWFNAVWTAKHLERGELWFARTAGCEGSMRQRLLEMIEWHAQAAHGPDHNMWERGRFMEEWADPRVIAELASVRTTHDQPSIRLALVNTTALYRWLSTETASYLGHEHSDALAENVTDWVAANTTR